MAQGQGCPDVVCGIWKSRIPGGQNKWLRYGAMAISLQKNERSAAAFVNDHGLDNPQVMIQTAHQIHQSHWGGKRNGVWGNIFGYSSYTFY